MVRAIFTPARLWWTLCVAFFLLSIWPIWSVRFPPLQDYPQHLLHAHILAHRDDPSFHYREKFDFDIRSTYAAFYAVTILASKLLPLELAGKLALTLAFVLTALLMARLAQRGSSDTPPWGLLLLFPFTCNQQYFQGNINYCYALPLLFLALLDFEDLTMHGNLVRLGAHVLMQILLFIVHPLGFLVYLVLAVAQVIATRPWRKHLRLRYAATALGVGLGCVVIWYAAAKSAGAPVAAFGARGMVLQWPPLGWTVGYYLCMFTGMRWHEGIDPGPVTLWLIIGITLVGVRLTDAAHSRQSMSGALIMLGVTGASVFLLPFAVADVGHRDVRLSTFIGWRLAAASYFLMAIVAGGVRLRGMPAVVVTACAGMLLVASAQKQHRVAVEVETIRPLIDRIPSEARILPLVFVRGSPELDPIYFDPHLHLHNYYHLARGGLSPYFWKAPLHLLHLKPGTGLPAPGEYSPQAFRWNVHADGYEYFLTRGAPQGFVASIRQWTDVAMESNGWILFARRRDL